jgi:hypothetical protein
VGKFVGVGLACCVAVAEGTGSTVLAGAHAARRLMAHRIRNIIRIGKNLEGMFIITGLDFTS